KNLEEGRCLHAGIKRTDLSRDSYLNNLLIAMYGRHGSPADARDVFDKLGASTTIFSWNLLITAFVSSAKTQDAAAAFSRMPQHDVVSWNAVLSAYTRSGRTPMARQLFDSMPQRSVVSWTTMITAYTESRHLSNAKSFFYKMPQHNKTGLLEKVVILFDRVPQCNMSSCNSTLVAYVQCGYLDQAHKLFARIPDRDLASWSIMILGCAGNRQERLALEHFGEMLLEGIKCDEITMLGVLSACNHLGLIQEGVSYFVMMVAELGIDPFVEHFSSLVDLLARVGQLREAHDLLRNMPFVPDPAACCSMLGACRTHGDVELGAYTAANEEFGIEPHHPSPYLLLSSM
ncbi:hypothetical protein SELMODRAFT_13509, partial [Selaginella moellendorffii]